MDFVLGRPPFSAAGSCLAIVLVQSCGIEALAIGAGAAGRSCAVALSAIDITRKATERMRVVVMAMDSLEEEVAVDRPDRRRRIRRELNQGAPRSSRHRQMAKHGRRRGTGQSRRAPSASVRRYSAKRRKAIGIGGAIEPSRRDSNG